MVLPKSRQIFAIMPPRVFATASLVHFKRQSFSFCESSGLGLVHMAESTLGRGELWAGEVDSSALSGRLPRGVGGFAQTPGTAPVAVPSLPYKSSRELPFLPWRGFNFFWSGWEEGCH